MGDRDVCARWTRGHRRARGIWLAVLTTLGVAALPAAADANATWTGAGTTPEWSNAANWSGTPPAANSAVGMLTFPLLSGCAAPKTCYTSHNGLTGVSATGLVFGNSSNQYRILQTTSPALTVGTGGISDTPGGGAGDVINDPLALSGAAQTWAVGSTVNGYNSLTFLGGITGSATAVTASIPRGDVFVDTNMEVGPVTVTGSGGLHIGGAPGSGHPGSVNGTNGQPLAVNGATLTANPSSTSGPLSLNSGTLQLGTSAQNNGTTTLQVKGAATLASSTTFKTFINNNGSTPGTDFSQLSASGNIAVGGQLVLGQGPVAGSCIALSPGDVATLVTTSGTLSGKFANASEGATLTLGNACPGAKVQIHYATNAVTATVLKAATISATTSPATGVGTTQATLNGTVSTGGAAVSWKFQYGTTTAYGKTTATHAIAAGQNSPVPVSAVVTGLSPKVLYHFRLVVTTTSQTINGKDLTFTTT